MKRTEKRYSLEPLAKALDLTLTRGAMIQPRSGRPTESGAAFCRAIGLNPGRLPRLLDPRNQNPGLDFYEADRAACSLGRRPEDFWPEWGDDDDPFRTDVRVSAPIMDEPWQHPSPTTNDRRSST